MTLKLAVRSGLIAGLMIMAGVSLGSAGARAWYCEAWSNQKAGWAKGWGRSPNLDRAKRLAVGNCIMRSRGKKVRCSITSCKQ